MLRRHFSFVRLLPALLLPLCAASAATRTWTGADGDGLWSTAGNWSDGAVPGSGDDVVFASSGNTDATVDADFAGSVCNLTLNADYTGTLTLQRNLTVRGKYIQNGGTFNGGLPTAGLTLYVGHSGLGTPNVALELNGGTFVAPKLLKWTCKANGVCSFKNMKACAFNANGGTVQFDLYSYYQIYFYSVDKVYNDVIFGGTTGSGLTFSSVSNNVITGTMTHSGGYLSTAGTCYAVELRGDVSVSGNANGGKARFLLATSDDQAIAFGEPTIGSDGYEYGRAASFTVDKPEGKKVKVTATDGTARFGCGTSKYDTWGGITVKSGAFDMSACSAMTAYTGASYLTAHKGEAIVFPNATSFTSVYVHDNYYALDFDQPKGDTFTFTNLTFHGNYASRMRSSTTNLVNGTLTIDGAGILSSWNRSDDYTDGSTSWVEGSSQKNATLLVKGDICVSNECGLTDTKQYGGTALTVAAGDGDQNLYYAGGALGSLVVDKKDGDKLICHTDGTPMLLYGWYADNTGHVGPHLIVRGGEFVFPKDGISMPNVHMNGFRQFGGKITHNNAPFTCAGYTINVDVADPLYDVTTSLSKTGGFQLLKTAVLTVQGKFTCLTGRIGYRVYGSTSRIVLQGDYAISPTAPGKWFGGNMPIYFTGTNVQHYSCTPAGSNTYETVYVSKTGGRLVLDSDMDFTKRMDGSDPVKATVSQNIYLNAGEIDTNGHTLTLPPKGTTTIADGFTLARPVADPSAPVVAAATVTLPKNGTLALRLSGKLTARSPTTVDVLSYGTLNNFSTCSFVMWEHPRVLPRFTVTDDTENRLIKLDWVYRRGLGISLR